jgi:hypothetical protein
MASRSSACRKAETLISVQHDRMHLEDSLDTLDLLVLLDGGVAQLGSSSGNKDLVSGHVVRNKEDRVQDPSDKIVDALAGRVGLVTTLVTADQSSPHRIESELTR